MARKRRTAEEQLAEAEKAEVKAAAETKRLRAKVREERKKRADRRKILWGALVEKLSEQHPDFRSLMEQQMCDYLKHDRDWALFSDLKRPAGQYWFGYHAQNGWHMSAGAPHPPSA